MRTTVHGWLCSTAWEWEAGETDITLWPTKQALKLNCKCIGKKTKDSTGRVIHECTPVLVEMQKVRG